MGRTTPESSESASERGDAWQLLPNKLELTVDEVIETHVGSLGLAQILHALVVSLAWILDAQTTLISIFSDAKPAARLLEAHASSNVTVDGSILCKLEPGTWEWVGGKRSSTVAEWNLICDHKFLAALPATLFFIGSLLGSGIYGYLADTWLGRKKTLLISCILTFITAFAISYSPNIRVYAILRFTNGLLRAGVGSSCIVLATELVGREWRGQVGQYGFFFFMAGFLSLPLMSFYVTTWRTLYKIIAFLSLSYTLLLLLLPFAFESPRWLLIQGRNEEAIKVLKRLAKLNGKILPTNLSLFDPMLMETDDENKEKLWKTKWAMKRVMVVMLAGFGTGFVYYGFQLNAENLEFNLYLTVAINALMEIPSVFIGSVLLGNMNRRPLFSNSSYIAGISCIICGVLSLKQVISAKGIAKWVQLAVESIGFMASSMSYDVMCVYCIELFPTNVRNFAVSLLRQAFMAGATAVPLLVAVGRVSPLLSFVVLGVVSVASGVLSLWLKETRNAPLYDTLRQQAAEENQHQCHELQ